MTHNALFLSSVLFTLAASTVDAQQRWVHPKCQSLKCTKNGPFEQLEDGTLIAFNKNVLVHSTDDGETWTEQSQPIDSGINFDHYGHVAQLLRTKAGTLILLYLDFDHFNFSWNVERIAPNPNCRLDLWSIRSRDGGKTWEDQQQLIGGYNADFMGLIQTTGGAVVATVEHLAEEEARWMACSFRSEDEGKSWKRSNWIDLGGRGHHDGAIEPTVTQLSDGRLLMLIRTTLDRFWKAYSDDDGRSWREIAPSGLDASSAPGWVRRLKSGRLVFVWNRLKPEGDPEVPRFDSAGFSNRVASMYREELSIAFSEDDGDSWTDPVVIAREPGGQLAYPYVHEREPGLLWVFTRYTWYKDGKQAPPLGVALREEEFVEK